MSPVPSRRALIAAGAGALLGLAGCAGAGDQVAGTGPFARIAGAFGATEIPARPVRIVALGFGKDADTAVALGVVPLVVQRSLSDPSGMEPWLARAVGAARPELIQAGTEPPVERIRADPRPHPRHEPLPPGRPP
ncbi:hypothetical protein GCM10023259_018380 [Thermocatellispora tengchongensis]